MKAAVEWTVGRERAVSSQLWYLLLALHCAETTMSVSSKRDNLYLHTDDDSPWATSSKHTNESPHANAVSAHATAYTKENLTSDDYNYLKQN